VSAVTRTVVAPPLFAVGHDDELEHPTLARRHQPMRLVELFHHIPIHTFGC